MQISLPCQIVFPGSDISYIEPGLIVKNMDGAQLATVKIPESFAAQGWKRIFGTFKGGFELNMIDSESGSTICSLECDQPYVNGGKVRFLDNEGQLLGSFTDCSHEGFLAMGMKNEEGQEQYAVCEPFFPDKPVRIVDRANKHEFRMSPVSLKPFSWPKHFVCSSDQQDFIPAVTILLWIVIRDFYESVGGE